MSLNTGHYRVYFETFGKFLQEFIRKPILSIEHINRYVETIYIEDQNEVILNHLIWLSGKVNEEFGYKASEAKLIKELIEKILHQHKGKGFINVFRVTLREKFISNLSPFEALMWKNRLLANDGHSWRVLFYGDGLTYKRIISRLNRDFSSKISDANSYDKIKLKYLKKHKEIPNIRDKNFYKFIKKEYPFNDIMKIFENHVYNLHSSYFGYKGDFPIKKKFTRYFDLLFSFIIGLTIIPHEIRNDRGKPNEIKQDEKNKRNRVQDDIGIHIIFLIWLHHNTVRHLPKDSYIDSATNKEEWIPDRRIDDFRLLLHCAISMILKHNADRYGKKSYISSAVKSRKNSLGKLIRDGFSIEKADEDYGHHGSDYYELWKKGNWGSKGYFLKVILREIYNLLLFKLHVNNKWRIRWHLNQANKTQSRLIFNKAQQRREKLEKRNLRIDSDRNIIPGTKGYHFDVVSTRADTIAVQVLDSALYFVHEEAPEVLFYTSIGNYIAYAETSGMWAKLERDTKGIATIIRLKLTLLSILLPNIFWSIALETIGNALEKDQEGVGKRRGFYESEPEEKTSSSILPSKLDLLLEAAPFGASKLNKVNQLRKNRSKQLGPENLTQSQNLSTKESIKPHDTSATGDNLTNSKGLKTSLEDVGSNTVNNSTRAIKNRSLSNPPKSTQSAVPSTPKELKAIEQKGTAKEVQKNGSKHGETGKVTQPQNIPDKRLNKQTDSLTTGNKSTNSKGVKHLDDIGSNTVNDTTRAIKSIRKTTKSTPAAAPPSLKELDLELDALRLEIISKKADRDYIWYHVRERNPHNKTRQDEQQQLTRELKELEAAEKRLTKTKLNYHRKLNPGTITATERGFRFEEILTHRIDSDQLPDSFAFFDFALPLSKSKNKEITQVIQAKSWAVPLNKTSKWYPDLTKVAGNPQNRIDDMAKDVWDSHLKNFLPKSTKRGTPWNLMMERWNRDLKDIYGKMPKRFNDPKLNIEMRFGIFSKKPDNWDEVEKVIQARYKKEFPNGSTLVFSFEKP